MGIKEDCSNASLCAMMGLTVFDPPCAEGENMYEEVQSSALAANAAAQAALWAAGGPGGMPEMSAEALQCTLSPEDVSASGWPCGHTFSCPHL